MTFKSPYSVAHREAVTAAMLPPWKMSARAAVAAAAAGELPNAPDLDPVVIPAATARTWGTAARRMHRTEAVAMADPAATLASAAGSVVALLTEVQEKARKSRKRVSPDDVVKHARAVKECAAMLRTIQGDGAGRNGTADPRAREADAGGGFLDGLAGDGDA
jgi:hypothetical protein